MEVCGTPAFFESLSIKQVDGIPVQFESVRPGNMAFWWPFKNFKSVAHKTAG